MAASVIDGRRKLWRYLMKWIAREAKSNNAALSFTADLVRHGTNQDIGRLQTTFITQLANWREVSHAVHTTTIQLCKYAVGFLIISEVRSG